MSIFKSSTPLVALEELLDKERVDILSGEFGNLQRNLAEKERLLQRISIGGTLPDLDRLRHKADRNQMMLGAVARGVRAVSERLGNLKATTEKLTTYDSSGRRSPQRSLKGNLERRA